MAALSAEPTQSLGEPHDPDKRMAKLSLLKQKLERAGSVKYLVDAVTKAMTGSGSQPSGDETKPAGEEVSMDPKIIEQFRSGSFTSTRIIGPNPQQSRKRPAFEALDEIDGDTGQAAEHVPMGPPPSLQRTEGPLLPACGSSNAGSLECLNATMDALQKQLEFHETKAEQIRAYMERVQNQIDTMAAATLAVAAQEAKSTPLPKPATTIKPSEIAKMPLAPTISLQRAASAPVARREPHPLTLHPAGPMPDDVEMAILASRIQSAVTAIQMSGGMSAEQAIALDGLLKAVPVVARAGVEAVGFTPADMLAEIARVLEGTAGANSARNNNDNNGMQ